MNSEISILIISGVGILNGLAFGVYLIFTKIGNRKANIFLGLFVILISIRFIRSVNFYLTPVYNHTEFFISSTCFLLLGPVLYLYVKANLGDKLQLKAYDFLQIFILLPLLLISLDLPDYLPIFKLLTYSSLAILLTYTILALNKLLKVIRRKKKNRKFITISQINWIRNLLFLIIINTFLYGINLEYRIVPNIFGATSYAIILYAIFIYWSKLQFLRKQRSTLEKYKNAVFDKRKAQEHIDVLLLKIEKEELYKDYTITLPELARILSVPQHYLSMIINLNLGKNFSEFMNDYRIDEACRMLRDEKYASESVQSIAYTSGFNSISVFYTCFKEHTGVTPTEYRKKNPDL